MSHYLTVVKKAECGYIEALEGIGYNKKQEKDMEPVALKLAPLDGGHNKFLESIYIWLSVRAPRYWWQEADTFRLSTKQSESTMHTLNTELARLNETRDLPGWEEAVERYIRENFEDGSICSPQMLMLLNRQKRNEPLEEIKRALPEGFLQRRMWVMNYKCLRNIILQRRHHCLPHWHLFLWKVLKQVDHPELLPRLLPRLTD